MVLFLFFYLYLKGQDSVVLCKYRPNEISVEQYYTTGQETPIILDSSSPSVGITNSQINLVDNFISCNFTRKKSVPEYSRYFDLNNKYYLFGAFGKYSSSSKFIEYLIVSNMVIFVLKLKDLTIMLVIRLQVKIK
jgi:hypothetical protein